MKKKILVTLSVASLLTLFGCPDDEITVEEAASKASKEMCDCIKDYSIEKCQEKLNSNYSFYANNDDFYATFNKVNNCGVTIKKEVK